MAPKPRDPQWLEEVSRPGPNGNVFPALMSADLLAATASVIMEDDTDPRQFTPGCEAYAGYTASSSFYNMPAVRAYATSQGARSFSYAPVVDATADALDMEPGNVGAGSFPAFWRAKGGKNVYGYGSASWVSQIIGAAAAAGISRSQYKIVSAHYIGQHICAPATCGYPQADATQFTSTYLGRNLDATMCSDGFFTGVSPNPDQFPIVQGQSGAKVLQLQKMLNKWATALKLSPALNEDGSFGPKTLAAVTLAQAYFHRSPTGAVDQALWNALLVAPVPLPTPQPWPVPSGLSVTAYPSVTVGWGYTGAPLYEYEIATGTTAAPGKKVLGDIVADNHLSGLVLPAPGDYILRVRSGGDTSFTPWHGFRA